jgi:glycosyltransferase involved in cell wall biosynthesis
LLKTQLNEFNLYKKPSLILSGKAFSMMNKGKYFMRVVALMTIRNEALYLKQCLEHLARNQVRVCLIDNQSIDHSMDIAGTFYPNTVVHMETLPYRGCFELEAVLNREQALAQTLEADWFLHCDADEIRQSPYPGINLYNALKRADQAGYNAVNFDEFVFLPCVEDEQGYEGHDYVKHMQYYYYFNPGAHRRVNAWKNTGQPVDLVSSGGHRVQFPGIRVYPDNFIMCHYIGLSRNHLKQKYAARKYSAQEIQTRGWHRKRAAFVPEKLCLPSRKQLKKRQPDGVWDRSDPWTRHEFLG